MLANFLMLTHKIIKSLNESEKCIQHSFVLQNISRNPWSVTSTTLKFGFHGSGRQKLRRLLWKHSACGIFQSWNPILLKISLDQCFEIRDETNVGRNSRWKLKWTWMNSLYEFMLIYHWIWSFNAFHGDLTTKIAKLQKKQF